MKTKIVKSFVWATLLATGASSCKFGNEPADEGSKVKATPFQSVSEGITPTLEHYNKDFLALKAGPDVIGSTENVDRFLKTWDSKPELTDDVKALVAQMRILIPLRGIVFRLDDLIKDSSDAVRSNVIASLMQVATGNRLLATNGIAGRPVESAKALSRYLAYPYSVSTAEDRVWEQDRVGKTIRQFENVAEFQDFMMHVIVPYASEALDIMKTINVPNDAPLLWDNKVIFGSNAYSGKDIEATDRYVKIYQSEINLIRAGLSLLIHNIKYFYSYNYDEMPKFIERVSKKIGFGAQTALGNATPQGISAKDRFEILSCGKPKIEFDPERKSSCRYNLLFTIRQIPGVGYGDLVLQSALPQIQYAVKQTKEAWENVKARGSDEPNNFALLNPARILPWQNISQKAIDDIDAVVNPTSGIGGIRDSVTGKVISIKFADLYKQETSPKNLKIFLPTQFSDSGARVKLKLRNGSTERVPNYEFGISEEWNMEAYKRYFVVENGSYTVPELVRFFSQSWAGIFPNSPLVTVSMVF